MPIRFREAFVEIIVMDRLSSRVIPALCHRSDNRPEVIGREERSLIWKLVGVKNIVVQKNG
ncbi:MAG: hypothetical protein Q7T80_06290 [Methanoregula sp.]|nr:hypothetical protein [Methanoregula sp.]